MARTCKCGTEYTGPMCAHCDSTPRCTGDGGKSCQPCLNARHVCPMCRTICPSVDGAKECEKADRILEIKQAKESA